MASSPRGQQIVFKASNTLPAILLAVMLSVLGFFLGRWWEAGEKTPVATSATPAPQTLPAGQLVEVYDNRQQFLYVAPDGAVFYLRRSELGWEAEPVVH